jgi:hypothetical protein
MGAEARSVRAFELTRGIPTDGLTNLQANAPVRCLIINCIPQLPPLEDVLASTWGMYQFAFK